MYVNIDEETVIELLVNRVKYWDDDEDTLELFENYYTNLVEGGCFDGGTLDIMAIVDNDYVNNTSIITREDFEKDREEYIEEELKNKLEELEDEEDTTEEEIRESLEEEVPTWEDLECGENNLDFLSGSYIESITNNLLLISY